MEILLDGTKILDKEILYITLKKQIMSDEFHGNNLDALWDVLSSYTDDLTINIINIEKLKSNLGDYSILLLRLFDDLNNNNEGVFLNINE